MKKNRKRPLSILILITLMILFVSTNLYNCVFQMYSTPSVDNSSDIKLLSTTALPATLISTPLPFISPTRPHPLPTFTPADSNISGQVVYESWNYSTDSIELFLYDFSTRTTSQLTNNSWSCSPSFSPDGSRIIYVSTQMTNNYDIFMMDSNGDNKIRLTDFSGFDGSPDWSPDGKNIAFVSDRDGNRKIFIMDVNSLAITQITYDDNRNDLDPNWSPDGRKITFSSRYPNENPQIFVINSDGSGLERIGPDQYRSLRPVWCPDQSCIIYETGTGVRGKFSKLMIINLETNKVQPLLIGANQTDPEVQEWYASRSPKSNLIVFTVLDLLYAYDQNTGLIFPLGIQASNASLFP